MNNVRQVQDAKARFSELLETSLKELLLAPGARTETLTPPRKKHPQHKPLNFE